VVIAIIGILAAMILTVLPSVMNSGKKTKAKLEAQSIVTAIVQYDSVYSHFPVSAAAQNAAAGGDFTYGGTFQKADGTLALFGTSVGASILTNSEVISILMSLTNYPDGSGPTVNNGFVKNPQKTIFLNAKMTGDTSSPGVGADLVYRDPWGNPYIITMDLNNDDNCWDAFYGQTNISSGGLNGLILQADNNGKPVYGYHGKVMVWSAGQPALNGKPVLDVGSLATAGFNKKHVLSWQ
jgi:type II secretory pathway pseudopilin PulG